MESPVYQSSSEMDNHKYNIEKVKMCLDEIKDRSLSDESRKYIIQNPAELHSNVLHLLSHLYDSKSIEYLLDTLHLNIWDIYFNKLANYNVSYGYNDKSHTYDMDTLVAILSKYDSIIQKFNPHNYCNSNLDNVIYQFNTILECFNYSYFEKSNYQYLLKQFIEEAYNISLWEIYLEILVKTNISKVYSYYKDQKYKWVFFRISINTVINLLDSILNIKLEDNITQKINPKEVINLFSIFFEIHKECLTMKHFIETNINKIIAVRHSHLFLRKFYHKYPDIDIFIQKDSHGYVPLIDCVRYSGADTLKWYRNVIMKDEKIKIQLLEDSINEVDLFRFSLNNSDKYVIEGLIDIFKSVKKNIFSNQISSYLRYNTVVFNDTGIKNIFRKLGQLFDFVAEYGNINLKFLDDILNPSMYSQYNNDQPRILEFKKKIISKLENHQKKLNNKISMDIRLYSKHISLFMFKHFDKTTMDLIRRIITCLERCKNEKSINNFIYMNILGCCCMCEIEDICNFIYRYNYGSNFKYQTLESILWKMKTVSSFSIYLQKKESTRIVFDIYKNTQSCGCNKYTNNDIVTVAKKLMTKNRFMYLYTDIATIKNKYVRQFEIILLNNGFFNDRYSFNIKKSKILRNYFGYENMYGENLENIKTSKKYLVKQLNTKIQACYILEQFISRSGSHHNDNITCLEINSLKRIVTNSQAINCIILNKLWKYKDIEKLLNHFRNDITILKRDIDVYRLIMGLYVIYKFIIDKTVIRFTNHKKRLEKNLNNIKTANTNNTINAINTNSFVGLNCVQSNEMNCALETNGAMIKKINLTTPDIFQFKDMIRYSKTHTVFTEKIDGVTKRNILLRNSFPKFPNNSYVSTEYIPESKIHFPIALRQMEFNTGAKSFVEYIDYLRSKHTYTNTTVIDSVIDLSVTNISTFLARYNDFKRHEILQFTKYIKIKRETIYNSKTFWWPKKFFIIKAPNLEDYLNFIRILSNNEDLHIFKNDGWIIQHQNYNGDSDLINEHLRSFKLKPPKLLTIDLEYKHNNWLMDNSIEYKYTDIVINHNLSIKDGGIKEGVIYRCYPIFDNKSRVKYFEARDKRTDKNTANSSMIIEKIMNSLERTINFDDINKYIRLSKAYYRQNNYSLNRITKYNLWDYDVCYKYISGKVFDIGGGYSTHRHLKHTVVEDCVSGDIDINCLLNNTPIKNKYLEITKPIESYNKLDQLLYMTEYFRQPYDSILMINCINFAFMDTDVSKNHLGYYLDKLSRPGTRLLIRFMDRDLFEKYIPITDEKHDLSDNIKENTNENTKENTVLIKCPNGPSYIQYSKHQNINKIYYDWVHDTPLDERLIGVSSLDTILAGIGWKNIGYQKHPALSNFLENEGVCSSNVDGINQGNKLNLWELYFKCFSCVVYEKE